MTRGDTNTTETRIVAITGISAPPHHLSAMSSSKQIDVSSHKREADIVYTFVADERCFVVTERFDSVI